MSLTLHRHGGVCRIAVLGRQDSAAASAELRAALLDARGTSEAGGIELSFYDADTLPREVLDALCELLDQDAGLQIVAYHALLAHSLTRLGLPVRQVVHHSQHEPAAPCSAVALAGSAQSLDKIMHIVAQLPLADAAIFVVQHVDEHQVSLLDQLLKTRTDYCVLMPQHLMSIQPGTLYVAPPGHHMKVAHGMVYLTRDRKVQFTRPSIDVLFESLAAEYGGGVLAALLCGFGRDGAAGCAALRRAGALVIVEDGADCEGARAMPDAARDAGHFDYVLNLQATTSVLAAALAGDAAEPQGPLLDLFLEAVSSQCGYDFRNYQRDSLQRRIRSLMQHCGFRSFARYQRAVLSDAVLFERLTAELPVGVMSFFRHPAQLRQIRDEILPYLASTPVIKLWSAGCSTGEEAYSLAILLDELGLLERSHLFATDASPYLLEQAKAGLFPAASQETNRSNYRASGGGLDFDSYLAAGGRYLRVPERLRQRLLFHRHSLTGEGIFNEFQLILCRNVLTYFDAALQRQVLRHFARSLHVDGFLVLGPQDGLHEAALAQGFVPWRPGSDIYRRGLP